MREIKFKRAYFINEDKTGFLGYKEWGVNIGESVFTSPTNMANSESFIDYQYIGLEDLINKKTYENDRIRYKYYHEDGKKVEGIAKIYFDGGCYFLEDVKTEYKYPMYCASLSFKIVGNIHENPEFLK